MYMETTVSKTKGGEFLIRPTEAEAVFTPEDFNEEQRMIAATCDDFLKTEVWPNLDRMDALEEGLMPGLLDKAGALGLLGISIPEQYGGFGKDLNTTMLVTDRVGAGHSFAVALSAHTGIGTLPILYFGTEAQKEEYLSKLATGEIKASYCLTEPGSGSDALAAKTKATLTPDGKHWILNGQKMWITNAGFADLFIVFAQVDGNKFTGFIVEKGTPGLSLGNEEHKMGIKGSSTRQVFFSDCAIPYDYLLGEIGKGHLIAFNILNIGRIKLGGAVLGASRYAAATSIRYANERVQFKKTIASFGAIQHKLAEQAIRIFALESALYRATNDIHQTEQALLADGKKFAEALLGAAQEYAIECAILKVAGSEVLDFVVDEGVQVFGGYGFSADYPMDRAYRDARINRIFEGTNEINRMLIIDMLLKKAMKGELDIMGPIMAVQKELTSIPDFGGGEEGLFAEEKKTIANLKKAVLMVSGTGAQKYQQALAEEQEIMMNVADMIIDIYMAESVLLRVEKMVKEKGEQSSELPMAAMKTYLYDMCDRISKSGKDAVNAMEEGDMQRMLLMGLKRFTKYPAFNSKEARRKIAAHIIAKQSPELV
jgi:alkylation response protein AidB-like acyl-CoA dehydrogenase